MRAISHAQELLRASKVAAKHIIRHMVGLFIPNPKPWQRIGAWVDSTGPSNRTPYERPLEGTVGPSGNLPDKLRAAKINPSTLSSKHEPTTQNRNTGYYEALEPMMIPVNYEKRQVKP